MKFHNNAFGRHEKRAIFLSFVAAAAALHMTSCAGSAEPALPPPVSEEASFSETEMQTLQTLFTETTAALVKTETTETSPSTESTKETLPVPDTEVQTPVFRTETKEEILTQNYETKYEYSYAYADGVRIVKQNGMNGEIKVTTVMTYEDDTLVDTSVQRETLKQKVDEVIIIGTRPVRTEKTVTVRENETPFDTEYLKDDSLYDDERTVIREGKNGYTVSVYQITYENGKEISRRLVSREVTAPVSAQIRIGTKPAHTEETVTVKESPVKYTTRHEYDDTMPVGEKKLKTAGADGYTEKTYRITYYKGTEQKKELVSEKTVAPVEEVILIGTKKEESYYMPFRDAAHGGRDYAVTQSYSSSHRALDFGVWYGEPICAIKSGRVIEAYNEGYFSTDNILWTYGTYVVIEHDDGMRSYYAHLKSKTVSVGQRVSGGEVIGYSGNTGRVNPAPTASDPLAGTHLHFEIRVKQGSSYVTTDPRKYLPYWN